MRLRRKGSQAKEGEKCKHERIAKDGPRSIRNWEQGPYPAVPGQLAGGSSSVPTESREESEVVDLQGVGRTDAGAAS